MSRIKTKSSRRERTKSLVFREKSSDIVDRSRHAWTQRDHQQGNDEYKDERFNDKSEDHKLETQGGTTIELDLNTHVENYCTTRPKQFDLNGFSWN